jgi:hypothetical protein
MNKLILSALVCFIPTLAYADISFTELSQLSTASAHLQGQFNQDKYLTDLEAHLHSSGEFEYQRGESIRWETLTPIANVLIMTPSSIRNHQGSHEILHLEADSNPAVTILSDIFFSVLTAEWTQLERYFDVSGTVQHGHWQVTLTPNEPALAHVVRSVQLQGDTHLRELTFFEQSGDSTHIIFTELTE